MPVDLEKAFEFAETKFFNLYTPVEVGNSKTFDKAHPGIRDQASKYATLLDRYNNGLIGPGPAMSRRAPRPTPLISHRFEREISLFRMIFTRQVNP
jgi:hypothetical protein